MIEDLRAFVAFIAHGSLSRAATQMKLSQPAVTRRIQRLEASIGGALLDRSVKPARPSALGAHLYERARVVLHEVDDLSKFLNEEGEPDGVFRIGAIQSISETTGVSTVTQLKRRFPKLQIEMQSDWSLDLIKKIQTGQLDVAAIMAHPSAQLPVGITGELIGMHRTVIVGSKTTTLKHRATLRQLADYPWVMYPEGGCILRAGLLNEFQSRGLNLNIAVSANGAEHQLALIAAGAGLGFVSEIMVKASRYREKLRVISVNDFKFEFAIWIIRSPFLGKLTAPMRLFRDVVTNRFRHLNNNAQAAQA